MESILKIVGLINIFYVSVKIINYVTHNTKNTNCFIFDDMITLINKSISKMVVHVEMYFDNTNNINYIPMNNIHRIKTIELCEKLKKIRNDKTMRCCDYDEFIDSVPLSSNYIVNIQKIRETKIGNVHKLLKYHCGSMVSIKQHIKLYDLNDECEVGLSRRQFDRLWELEHWNIYR